MLLLVCSWTVEFVLPLALRYQSLCAYTIASCYHDSTADSFLDIESKTAEFYILFLNIKVKG